MFCFDFAKGYGIATPKGSIWRDKISLAILELQEKGEIQILYNKWWKNTEETCVRDEKHKDTKANSLGVENIGILSNFFTFCYFNVIIPQVESSSYFCVD